VLDQSYTAIDATRHLLARLAHSSALEERSTPLLIVPAD
jgi:hypothetical protein